jgi:polyphosphate kinase 2 (PPK2 family)
MIERTSTVGAPWTVISGNDKHYARVQALQTVVDRVSERLKAGK